MGIRNKKNKTAQLFSVTVAMAGWFAVIIQFYFFLVNRPVTATETTLRFFSYYTILTNMMVALCFTILFVNPESHGGRFFSRPGVLTAVACYISFVSLANYLLLQHASKSEGLQVAADQLLHFYIPFVVVLYWLIYVPKGTLHWKGTLPWLLYPVVYLLYILIRGIFSGFYPYPFVNVNNLGFRRVILNDGGLIAAFLFLSLLYVALGKILGKWARLKL